MQELNLIDSFLFGASTEKIQDAEFIAKLIIERATNQKVDKISVVSEKELTGIDVHHHGIRMDLYVKAYENQMLYTVKNYIEEFPELVYNDGVKKLFLYVGGELGGTEKLKSLLQYFSKSDTSNATDADLEHLHSIVENAKHKQEVGKRYMTLQDMIDYEKKQILEQLMQKFSLTMEEAKAYLNETTNLM